MTGFLRSRLRQAAAEFLSDPINIILVCLGIPAAFAIAATIKLGLAAVVGELPAEGDPVEWDCVLVPERFECVPWPK